MKMNKDKNLFWVDVETTGLNAESDAVLEIASAVTDSDLNIIAQGPDVVIYQTETELKKMPDSVRSMHQSSGLLARVKKSKLTIAEAEEQTLKFVSEYCGFKTSPFCGNTVGFDKEIIRKQMPRLFRYLHYRTIDVTSISELCKRWYPKLELYEKKKGNTAKDDVVEAIEELKYYRSRIFA